MKRDLFASLLVANGWRYIPSLALAHIVTMDALARNEERKRPR